MTRSVRSLAIRAALLAAVASPAAAQVYADPSAPIDARVEDLIGRMTLEEKAAQMQNAAPAIPRLNVPAYEYWNEALHGVARAGEATVFPQAIGMAATWDKDLFLEEGKVVAVEGRAKYNEAQRDGNHGRYFGLTFWSPNINIFRDPRWGRGQETLGEDPYLTGVLATEFIRGVQGDDPRYYSAIATSKHFAVHSGPEPLRHGFNVDPSPRDMAETYLPAFRRTMVDGKAHSLMCAYNAVDGKPACASDMLLQDILRKDWGFDGLVVSDCGAIDDITTGHHYTKTNAEAAAIAVKAGTDLACTFKDEYLDLPEAVAQGLITEAEMDVALRRIFTARMKLGLFDPAASVPFAAIPWSANHSPEHQQLALRAAREAIVLLKNDGVLPLGTEARRIAVVGPSAASLIGLLGNYNGTPVDAVLPIDGMREAFGADNVIYAQGSPFVEGSALPVSRTAFGDGVTASFYNGTDFAGQPLATRTDREIDHNWNWVTPAPGVDPNDFSVRWTGTITPPAPGEYRFQFEQRRCDANAEVERYTIRIEGTDPLHVDAGCTARDAADGDKAVTVRLADTRPRAFVLEYAHRAPAYAPHVTFAWSPPAEALRAEALKAASGADVIVAMVGFNAWLEGEEMPVNLPGFNGGDRTDIALPAAQAALLDALQATGKPVVVVLQSGAAVALGKQGEAADAVLAAWYGGEKGGHAIAEVLRGTVNPGGRLPVTFYKSASQLPPFEDYGMVGRTYRYFEGDPEYPFGHGLSYTSFAYSGLSLGKPALTAGEEQTVSVRVRNTGEVAGDEVVQLYLTTAAGAGAPIRSLKGFERIHLAPDEEKLVRLTLSPRDLAFAGDDGVMRITPADYRLWIGGGQPGTSAPGTAGAFQITGSLEFPR